MLSKEIEGNFFGWLIDFDTTYACYIISGNLLYGSFPYAAPECFLQTEQPIPRDLFEFGVALYIIVLRKNPSWFEEQEIIEDCMVHPEKYQDQPNTISIQTAKALKKQAKERQALINGTYDSDIQKELLLLASQLMHPDPNERPSITACIENLSELKQQLDL